VPRPRGGKVAPVVAELKRRLRRAGVGHLSVHRGGGTAYGYIEVHRKDGASFSESEAQKLSSVVGENVGKTNFYCITDDQLEMKLGMSPKQPICPVCGTIYATEEGARECILSH